MKSAGKITVLFGNMPEWWFWGASLSSIREQEQGEPRFVIPKKVVCNQHKLFVTESYPMVIFV